MTVLDVGLGRFMYWLAQGQNAAAVQAVSTILTTVFTIVLATVTIRYTKLMAKSVRISEQNVVLANYPKLRLNVHPIHQERRKARYYLKNVGPEDVKLLSVTVLWQVPEGKRKSSSALSHKLSERVRLIMPGVKGVLVSPDGFRDGTVDLPPESLTAQYLDLSDEEAAEWLTVVVTCTNLTGIGQYRYQFNVTTGYSCSVLTAVE